MTIKDIARICGVSVSTVSRVLNNHPDAGDEVKEKVLSVVKEYNYVPNNSARELGKSRSDSIGIIVRGISNPFYTGIIHTLQECIEDSGYTMVLTQIGATDDEIRAGAMMEREKRLLGLIFLGGRSDYTPEEIASVSVPYVFCTYDNSFGALDKSLYSSVSINDIKTGYEAVKTLIEHGHRNIAMLLSSRDDSSVSELRFKGYKKALEVSGIAMNDDLIIEAHGYELADGYNAINRWLENRHDYSAIFSISDYLSIGALRALREHGIRVPEDCSVLSIDGLEVADYTYPALSTFSQPVDEIGKQAVEILVSIIRETGHNRQMALPATLKKGQSLAAPAQGK